MQSYILPFFILLLRAASAQYGLYLAINPIGFEDENGTIIRRRLEINWFGDDVHESDAIYLTHGNALPLIFAPHEHQDNFIITDIVLPYPTSQDMGFQPACVFGYRATWERESSGTLASGCLQSEPTWIQDLSVSTPSFNGLQIGQMLLAGSHDAGAYKQYEGVEDDNWITSATFAQEEDFLHQLIWGVRFLDIRVGHYPSTDIKFWLVHGIIKTHPMMEGIEDVKTFLRNTREIVVWEVNGFEQVWDDQSHQEFKTLLKEEFSKWLVTPDNLGWGLTLGEILERDGLPEDQGRIIITYNNAAYTEPEFFFPEVLERWGDKDDPLELKLFLETEVAEARGNPEYQPWKPNCQMTPNALDIIGGRWSGLRDMANAVNRNVTRWWREEWSDLPATFSIHDFIKGTNMVEESIRRNRIMADKIYAASN